jgi:hypothetical protein
VYISSLLFLLEVHHIEVVVKDYLETSITESGHGLGTDNL